LSEVGYAKLFKELKADPEAVVILGGWSSPMTNKTLLVARYFAYRFLSGRITRIRQRDPGPGVFSKTILRLLASNDIRFLACGKPTVEHLVSLVSNERK